jgi:hypothetical protein
MGTALPGALVSMQSPSGVNGFMFRQLWRNCFDVRNVMVFGVPGRMDGEVYVHLCAFLVSQDSFSRALPFIS